MSNILSKIDINKICIQEIEKESYSHCPFICYGWETLEECRDMKFESHKLSTLPIHTVEKLIYLQQK